jgi:hypothetical protein
MVVVLHFAGHWVQLLLRDSGEQKHLCRQVEQFLQEVGRASFDMPHRPIPQPQAEERAVE